MAFPYQEWLPPDAVLEFRGPSAVLVTFDREFA